MNRRSRHRLLWTIWIAVFLIIGSGLWDLFGGSLALLLFLGASVVVYILYAFFARCPQCGTPVLLRTWRIGRMEIYGWSCMAPERCRKCGKPFE
ncbi:MAG: hypothetical protein M0042_04300 [Nitrospiraceae bacterium]|nr:hypothetical protein [Nitrospiraceae bacterium]